VNTGTKTLTFATAFPYEFAVGDTYAVSPVPFSLRAWPIQVEGYSRFNRWIVAGVCLKSQKLSGFDSNVNDKWRVGVYRNGSATLETAVAYPDVDDDPQNSAEVLNVHGVDIEPYVEQIAAGVMFELTDAEFNMSMTDSRKDKA
jgi:hypothetical protein